MTINLAATPILKEIGDVIKSFGPGRRHFGGLAGFFAFPQ